MFGGAPLKPSFANMSNIADKGRDTDTSYDGVLSTKRDLCAKSAWIMTMCLASASTVKWMFLIHTHQRPSGSIRLPGASDILYRKNHINALDRNVDHNYWIGIYIQWIVDVDLV